MKMKIVIIGSGNVATVFGKLFLKKGHEIVQVTGRNNIAVKKLARQLKTTAEINFQNIFPNADLYIIAVSDDAVEKVAAEIFLKNKLIVHTAGAVSKDVLKNVSENYGVIYPLQSIRKELKHLPEMPLLVDGNSEETKNKLLKIAKTISSNVEFANDKARLNYHAAAVIVSNFSNHLFALTKDFCRHKKIDFTFLFPIIKETVWRIEEQEPSEMQTGPAIRNDKETMKKHEELLSSNYYLGKIYRLMSKSIESYY